MAKKSKDPSKASTSKSEENAATPDNIFSKLFGAILDAEPTNSLFSTDNPFRRKPIDSTQTSSIVENPNNAEVEKPNLKPKKRNMDESSLKEEYKKLNKNSKLGTVNGLELNVETGEKEEKKKKRKREEIEREYEMKKYGAAPEEEEKKKEKVGGGKKRKSADNPAEMMVSQEGYDDESKLLRTIFVGNLPLKIKKKALMKEFSKFGEIESVRIRSVPTLENGKKPKKAQIISGKINEAADSVNAYVVFKTEQGAEASLVHNMSMVEGNHIRVDRACPPRKKLKGDASASLYSSKRTIFVGNLPFDVKDEELYQLFCNMKELKSTLEAVRVIRDQHTGLGKGIAYVLFKTREAANFICRKHNLKLRDRELRICHAKSSTQSTTTAMRKSPFQGDSESSPAKKISAGTKTPDSRYKVSAAGNTSYQGLRASKSGEKKKTPQRRSAIPVAVTSGKKKSAGKIKQRTDKRPAVAARKAEAKKMQSGGAPNYTGSKRKMDARTPQSSNKKKAKKFK